MSTATPNHRKSFAGIVIEVVLITIGVFLALLASNWHEDREHRAQARSALRNFVGEMQANEQAVKQYRTYHQTLARELELFLKSTEPMTNERFKRQVHFEGVRPIIFEHTAWDLALATQALAHVEPHLAFQISTVYTRQNAFQTLENSFLSSAFTPAGFSSDSPKGLATAIWTYLGDVNHEEPLMLGLYAKTIPEIRRSLAGTSASP